jgi:hypothetical protein
MCLDTRGTNKLDGILAMRKVCIPYLKSCTLAIKKLASTSKILYIGNDSGGDHDVDLHTWEIYMKNSLKEYFN